MRGGLKNRWASPGRSSAPPLRGPLISVVTPLETLGECDYEGGESDRAGRIRKQQDGERAAAIRSIGDKRISPHRNAESQSPEPACEHVDQQNPRTALSERLGGLGLELR